MKLPPWNSDDPDDQLALAAFVIAELTRDELKRAVGDALPQSAEEMMELIRRHAAEWDARKALQNAKLIPSKAKRPGPQPIDLDTATDFDMAVRDVPRIRALFMLHWGKRNRMKRPQAEAIASLRWGLSDSETAKLIDKFQRKS